MSHFGLLHTERHRHSGAMPVEGHQAGEAAVPHSVQGEAEGAGLVQPREDSIFSYGSIILSTEDPRNCTTSAVSSVYQWVKHLRSFWDENHNTEVKLDSYHELLKSAVM